MAATAGNRPGQLLDEDPQQGSSEPRLVQIATKRGPELVRVIESFSDADWLAEQLSKETEPVGLDCETEGIDPTCESPSSGKGRIVLWSLSSERLPRTAIWVRPETNGFAPSISAWLESDAPKVGHNLISFDSHMFRNHGIKLGGIHCDTLRLHQLVFTKKTISKSLKSLMHYWLGLEPVGEFRELFTRRKSRGLVESSPEGVFRSKRNGVSVPGYRGGMSSLLAPGFEGVALSTIRHEYPHLLNTLYDYATLDALATRLLYEKLRPYVEALSGDMAAGSTEDCGDGSPGDGL